MAREWLYRGDWGKVDAWELFTDFGKYSYPVILGTDLTELDFLPFEGRAYLIGRVVELPKYHIATLNAVPPFPTGWVDYLSALKIKERGEVFSPSDFSPSDIGDMFSSAVNWVVDQHEAWLIEQFEALLRT